MATSFFDWSQGRSTQPTVPAVGAQPNGSAYMASQPGYTNRYGSGWGQILQAGGVKEDVYSPADRAILENASPYGSFFQDRLKSSTAALDRSGLNPAALAAARQRLANQYFLQAGNTALPVWTSMRQAGNVLYNKAQSIPTTSSGQAFMTGLSDSINRYAPYIAAAYAGATAGGGGLPETTVV